jgi:hypothetical protein
MALILPQMSASLAIGRRLAEGVKVRARAWF